MSESITTAEQLISRELIKDTKYKYFRALDSKTFELLEDVLTVDVVINYGPMGLFKDRNAFLATIMPLNTDQDGGFASARGLHHALNPEITFLSHSEAECYWVTHFVSYDPHRQSYLQQSGHYTDRNRREGDRWKISESNYTLWFHQSSSLGAWTPLFPNGPTHGAE